MIISFEMVESQKDLSGDLISTTGDLMKIREGFVSNSSSASFVVKYKGVEITLEVFGEYRNKLENMLDKMVEAKIIDKYERVYE